MRCAPDLRGQGRFDGGDGNAGSDGHDHVLRPDVWRQCLQHVRHGLRLDCQDNDVAVGGNGPGTALQRTVKHLVRGVWVL